MTIKLYILAVQLIFAGVALVGLVMGMKGQPLGLVLGVVCGLVAFCLGIVNLLVKVPS